MADKIAPGSQFKTLPQPRIFSLGKVMSGSFIFFFPSSYVTILQNFQLADFSGNILMRLLKSIYGILLILAILASPVHAEFSPWNMRVSLAFRVEYLYGSQVTGTVSDYGSLNPDPNVQLDISFGFPIVSGAVEIFPFSRLSAHLSADASVYGQRNIIYGSACWKPTSGPPNGLYSNSRPGFAGFEVAGLFDAWRPAGHRFGVTGGWRSEYWWYEGGDIENGSVGAEDNVSSSIPFAGFFAEMAYPGWRSTWQFLASRFVSKEISGWVRQPSDFGEYHCAAQGGVLLEGRIQGEANITSNLFFGLYGRYSYQNVSGVFDEQSQRYVVHQ